MTRQEALKHLQKRLGSKFGYRVDPAAPSADERAEARELHKELVAKRDAVNKAMTERRVALLQDPEYQRLYAEYKAADKVVSKNASKQHWFKFTVGVDQGIFFLVKAQGDSWEEILTKLNGSKP